MTLDIEELVADWACPAGELRARVFTGADGTELLQLRVDLGLMQMFPTGRPDGQRYRGMPSAADYVGHELRLGSERVVAPDWEELERELLQLNYRRMAYAALSEAALRGGDDGGAREFLRRGLLDIDACLSGMRLLGDHRTGSEDFSALESTLLFDQARLAAQLRIIESRFEEAVEQAEAGAAALEALLSGLGYDEEQCAQDAGLQYLRNLGRQLRREYNITQTLAEQLADALAREDFEAAAELRDELERRRTSACPPPDPDRGPAD